MVGFAGARRTGRRVLSEFSEKNVTFMAAGIAYNAFVSLAPMLLLVLLVASAFGGGLETRIVALAKGSLPRPIADLVSRILGGDSASAGASVVGLIVLLWGTLKIFRGLDTAFSEIYETERRNSLVDQLRDGVVVLFGLLVAVLATAGASAAFTAYEDAIPFLGLLTPVVLVVGLFGAFLPIYYLFPDTDLDWPHVIPGVAVSAVGWALLQSIFQVYLLFKGGGSESFLGSVLVVVTWLYFSGVVLLLGAVINAVLGGYASGTPSGVGRRAGSAGVEREESLSPEEFDRYLRRLREQLGGRYERMRPMAREDGAPRPRPAGDVELLERRSVDDDGETWSVEFTWSAAREAGRDDSS